MPCCSLSRCDARKWAPVHEGGCVPGPMGALIVSLHTASVFAHLIGTTRVTRSVCSTSSQRPADLTSNDPCARGRGRRRGRFAAKGRPRANASVMRRPARREESPTPGRVRSSTRRPGVALPERCPLFALLRDDSVELTPARAGSVTWGPVSPQHVRTVPWTMSSGTVEPVGLGSEPPMGEPVTAVAAVPTRRPATSGVGPPG